MSENQFITQLSDADQKALDALIESGLDAESLAQGDAERADRLRQVLGLLDHLPGPAPSEWLTSATMRLIDAHESGAMDEDDEAVEAQYDIGHLSEADCAALDALVDSEFSVDDVPPIYRPRAANVAHLLSALDQLPAPRTGDLLMPRTLARIDAAKRTAAPMDALGVGGQGFRWPELITAAALLLIGISVVWPMLTNSSAQAQMMACQNNLRNAAAGFGTYAASFNGALPRMAVRVGDPWWYTGQVSKTDQPVRSNSAHLYLLIRQQHVKPQDLVCPSNKNAPRRLIAGAIDWEDCEKVSYSYQNQFTVKAQQWTAAADRPILGDKNPNFTLGRFRAELKPTALSRNHAALSGQNVLMGNGSVARLQTPVLEDGDNIYHRGSGQTAYRGNETPLNEHDTMLVP